MVLVDLDHRWCTRAIGGVKIYGVPTPRQSTVASAASALLPFEAEQLAATATGLPSSWVLAVEPPYGQLAPTPRLGRRRNHRCVVVDGARRIICRDAGTLNSVDRLRYPPTP